jgi:hypothetical protein
MNLPGVLGLLAAFSLGLFLCLLSSGRRGKIAGAIVLTPTVLIGSFYVWRQHRLTAGYSRIEVGASRAHVEQLLGKPTRAADCSTTYAGTRMDSQRPPAGCIQEDWYYLFFFPGALEYSFDKADRVIYKYFWQSP